MATPKGMGQPPRIGSRIPKPLQSRRFRWILFAVIVALIVLLFSLRGIAGFYTDYLWFDALGQNDVWRRVLVSQIVLALIFIGFLGLLIYGNLAIADRIAPSSRPDGPEEDVLKRYHASAGRRPLLVRLFLTLVFAIPIGAGASDQWEEWLLLTNRVDFGVKDPQFSLDIGFYVFQLPFVTYVVDWLFNVTLLTFFITAVAHYLNGGIRLQNKGNRVTPQVKAHLSVLLGVLALIRAGDYFLGRYELTTSRQGVVDGATYTDVNARLPIYYLLILISLLAFVLLLYNIRRKGWVLPTVAVGLWIFVTIVMGGIYPLIIQRFQVDPDESAKEREYIARNIEKTREAMGLDNVENRLFRSTGELTYEQMTANPEIIGSLPILDPKILSDTFENLEGERPFYRFPKVLDIDRYEVDGKLTPVVIGARQLNPEGLPQRSWEARALTYTHGFGVSLAPASSVEDGLPDFRISGLPINNELDVSLDEPRLYYGEDLGDYAVVRSGRKEVDDAEGAGQAVYTYQGEGGVTIGGFVRQAAFALRFWDINTLISGFVTDESRIIFYRDIRERVTKLAPFLHADADPYPVIAGGRVHYILDAYTTTARYPYGQRADTEQLDPQSGLRHDFNYVRNSVKAVVDAFDGSVTLYVREPDDPIINAYRQAFPKLLTDFSEMPDDLKDHIRYPEDLFRVQTNMWARYQLGEPQEFYEQAEGWAVAQDPGAVSGSQGEPITTPEGLVVSNPREARIEPYYILTRLPSEEDQDFVILRSYVPVSAEDTRKELTAFIVGKSDPDEYGQLVAYRVEPRGGTDGPALVNAKVQTEIDISRFITLLNQQGSRVQFGDLLLIPIENSVLYVRALYVVAQSTQVPELRQVIAVLGENVVMCPTLGEALRGVFGLGSTAGLDCVGNASGPGATEPSTTEPVPPATTTTTSSPASSTTTTTTASEPTPQAPPPPPADGAEVSGVVADLLSEADAKFTAADEALREGRLDLYQQRIEEAQELIARAAEYLN